MASLPLLVGDFRLWRGQDSLAEGLLRCPLEGSGRDRVKSGAEGGPGNSGSRSWFPRDSSQFESGRFPWPEILSGEQLLAHEPGPVASLPTAAGHFQATGTS